MKVLTEGKVDQPPAPPWWVGREVRCPRDGCGFVGQLEETDRAILKISNERSPNGDSIATLTCPTPHCHGIITIRRKQGGFTPREAVSTISPARFDRAHSDLDRAMQGDMGGIEDTARRRLGMPRTPLESDPMLAGYGDVQSPPAETLRAQIQADRDEQGSPDDLTVGERQRHGL